MADIVDALVFKLQSKICYHRDAHVEYLEIKTMVDKLVKENKKLQDEKLEFLDLINFVTKEKENLQHDYQVIKEGVAPVKEQLETVKKELEKTKHEHVAAKKELEETKHEHVAARKELEEAKHEHVEARKELKEAKHEHVAAKKGLEETKYEHVAAKELEEANHEHVAAKKELEEAKQQLAQRNEELEVLRKKLQESEAMHTQSAPGPEPVHSRRVTRSTHKREMSLQGLLSNDVDGHRPKKHRSNQHASREDELEVIRQKLIKEFTEIGAGQYLGIKEMGKLDEKPFRDACAMKLPPRKSGARAFEVYTLWQELLNNPNWKPFKTVTVEEVVIDVDDVKLQELKRAWGEGPFNSVISALQERKEYNIDGRGRAVDFWNYEEGRKATTRECVEHILDALRNSNSSV